MRTTNAIAQLNQELEFLQREIESLKSQIIEKSEQLIKIKYRIEVLKDRENENN